MASSVQVNPTLHFTLADWSDQRDCDAVVALLQAYALHPMGGAEALSEYAVTNLPAAMAKTPGAFSVIGWHTTADEACTPVALANCFQALSTFACKPLINIHDLYVSDSARGQGAGQALLANVEAEAERRGCCKVTLEVLTGNAGAIRAYENFGFALYTLDEKTGHALFMHKKLK